jgi:hypothetical protein
MRLGRAGHASLRHARRIPSRGGFRAAAEKGSTVQQALNQMGSSKSIEKMVRKMLHPVASGFATVRPGGAETRGAHRFSEKV